MKIFKLFDKIRFGKNKTEKKTGGFSNFLINASAKEKERVFRDAAIRANEDQRELARKANLKLKTE
jgi:hypothetical protein